MNAVEENDTYVLWRHYTLSDTDREVLSRLYLPLIGFEAYSLYLFCDARLQNKKFCRGFVSELRKNVNFDGFHFIQAHEKLEAIGLLRTYKKKAVDNDQYIFDLQQPLDPAHFFKEVLLFETLQKMVGPTAFANLKLEFSIDKRIDKDFVNISADFEDYFSIDDGYFKKFADGNTYLSRDNDLVHFFNFDEFKNAYNQIQPFSDDVVFDEKTLGDLQGAAELYQIPGTVLARLYDESVSSRGVFNPNSFWKKARKLTESTLPETPVAKDNDYIKYLGDNDISKKIKAFTKLSPAEVMYYISKSKPQSDDYATFELLESEYHLIPSVINVIIDYTLAATNGSFQKNYATKIARTIIYNEANNDPYLAYLALYKQIEKLQKKNIKERTLQNGLDGGKVVEKPLSSVLQADKSGADEAADGELTDEDFEF